MAQSEILIRILLTVIFGSILGLETETREIEKKGKEKAKQEEKSRIGGMRTYTVLSLIGGVSGLLFVKGEYVLTYITFFGLIGLVVSAYIENIRLKEAFGLTTEVAIFITYLIGFMTTSGLIDVTTNLVILVLLTFFLSQKRGIGKLVEKIQHEELIDLTKFGLVSIVALPLLPNRNFFVSDIINALSLHNLSISQNIANINIINPFRIWLIVVIISGLDLGAYLLSKAIGARKGILLTSIFGGTISSTSATIALARKSKDAKEHANLFAGSAIVSNAVSFISMTLIALVINYDLFKKVIPAVLAMFVLGIVTGLVIISAQKNKAADHQLNLKHQPFSISPAVKFIIMVVIIQILIQVLSLFDKNIFVVLLTALSGTVGVDAPTIAISELANTGKITLYLASLIFIATNWINFIAKIVYGRIYGSKAFVRTLALGLLITTIGSLILFI